MAKTELAVVDKFQLVTGTEEMDDELRAELAEEAEGLEDEGGIDARHIKIPSGGGKAFEVETDDPDDPEVMKEVQGVVLFSHRMNAYWAHKFGESDADGNASKIPDCSSMDGKKGVERATGEIKECMNCPYNQFGSDGAGKACKNMRRLYIMMSGRSDLYLLTVPPTSVKEIGKKLKEMVVRKKLPYTTLIMSFKLIQADSKDGIKYSKVTMDPIGKLPDNEKAATRALFQELKKSYESVGITAADYEAPETESGAANAGSDEFMNVPEGTADENLPFE